MDYVTFEIAKKLKEKGYKWKCYAFYIPCARILICNQSQWRGGIFEDYLYSHNSLGKDVVGNDLIDAPTIPQVLKWLREEKKIYIMIDRSFAMNNSWHYSICVDDDFENIIQQESVANKSWEQSSLDSIEYVLDNLI